MLRPDRGLAVEARSLPTQMSCGVEPELERPPGRRNSAWMTNLVVYNDLSRDASSWQNLSRLSSFLMGRAGWLRGLLLVACLAGGDAYVVPTSQHVLQLAARRAASPPPRAPSTTATVSRRASAKAADDRFDEQMKVRRVRVSRSDGRCAPPQCVCVGWVGGRGGA